MTHANVNSTRNFIIFVKRNLLEKLGACLTIAVLLELLLFDHVESLFIFVEGYVTVLAELSERYERLEIVLESKWVVRHA